MVRFLPQGGGVQRIDLRNTAPIFCGMSEIDSSGLCPYNPSLKAQILVDIGSVERKRTGI